MPNQKEGAWLPAGNNLQMRFYIYTFGLLYQTLRMWLISNIVKICGADMPKALCHKIYCTQSPVASLITGAATGGNTEIVPPFCINSSVTYSNHGQAFYMQLLLRPEKVLFFVETSSLHHVVS